MELVYNAHQVSYFGDHTEYLGSSLVFYYLADFSQSQCVKCSFLNCGTFDAAFYLFDFDCFHVLSSVLYPLNTFSRATPRF